MTLNEIRQVIKEVIAEAKEKGLPKSGGKLVHLKKELKSLKAMKESLAQYTINEGTAEPIVEFAHLQRFVNEMAKIKMAHSKLAEMLDNQISEVEGKVSAETQKIKEMMGLIEPQAEAKKKKSAKKKEEPKEEPKEEEPKEEPKEKKGKKVVAKENQLNEYEIYYELVDGQCRKYNDEGEYTVVPRYYCD